MEQNMLTDICGASWINAQKFGMIADGETPNDEKMSEYIEHHYRTPLYFPEGVYCFEKSLDFSDSMHILLDPNAELRCIAKEPLECFVTLRKDTNTWCRFPDYGHQSYVKGGTINANYCAKIGIGILQGYHTQFENLKIMNVLEKGIQTRYSTQNFGDGYGNFDNIVIYNDRCLPGTYAVYDNHVDCHFTLIHTTNFETAFYTHGGRFYNCSAWNLDMSVVGTSVFAEVARGHQSLFVNCSVDTYRYGFILKKGPWGYASCAISNMTWITNKNFYNEQMQAEFPRTIFLCDEPEQAQFYVVGAQVPWEGHLAFSNAEMPNSIFMNIRFPIGTHGIPYMRNDTEILRALAQKPAKTALDASDDFDAVTAAYAYDCDLRVGEGGNNVPPVKETGVLEVTTAGAKVVQKFIGAKTVAHRIFDGEAWSAWTLGA